MNGLGRLGRCAFASRVRESREDGTNKTIEGNKLTRMQGESGMGAEILTHRFQNNHSRQSASQKHHQNGDTLSHTHTHGMSGNGAQRPPQKCVSVQILFDVSPFDISKHSPTAAWVCLIMQTQPHIVQAWVALPSNL